MTVLRVLHQRQFNTYTIIKHINQDQIPYEEINHWISQQHNTKTELDLISKHFVLQHITEK